MVAQAAKSSIPRMTPPDPPADFAAKVAVLVDGEPALYWDRAAALNDAQRAAVDGLETRLRQGFEADGRRYERPDALERAQFAASMIPQALERERDDLAATALALVCAALPDLKQLQCRRRGDGRCDIAFVTDRCYAPGERPLRPHPRPS